MECRCRRCAEVHPIPSAAPDFRERVVSGRREGGIVDARPRACRHNERPPFFAATTRSSLFLFASRNVRRRRIVDAALFPRGYRAQFQQAQSPTVAHTVAVTHYRAPALSPPPPPTPLQPARLHPGIVFERREQDVGRCNTDESSPATVESSSTRVSRSFYS